MESDQLKSQQEVLLFSDTEQSGHAMHYSVEENWLHSEYKGFVTKQNLIVGANNAIEWLNRTKCPNLLVNHLAIRGTWPDTTDWRMNIWVPKAIEAGLKKYAHVACAGSYSVMVAEHFYSRLNNQFEMMIFSDLAEAKAWLIS